MVYVLPALPRPAGVTPPPRPAGVAPPPLAPPGSSSLYSCSKLLALDGDDALERPEPKPRGR